MKIYADKKVVRTIRKTIKIPYVFKKKIGRKNNIVLEGGVFNNVLQLRITRSSKSLPIVQTFKITKKELQKALKMMK